MIEFVTENKELLGVALLLVFVLLLIVFVLDPVFELGIGVVGDAA